MGALVRRAERGPRILELEGMSGPQPHPLIEPCPARCPQPWMCGLCCSRGCGPAEPCSPCPGWWNSFPSLTTSCPCWTITAASSLSCCTYTGECSEGRARAEGTVREEAT